MSKNRHNTTPDYTPKQERQEKEVTLYFTACLVCEKDIKTGYYGRFKDGGVCSKSCNAIQETRPKFDGEPIAK